jgi:undecaprenyl-diphosphatase
MEIFDAAILGAVQGVTEFLPISSSGHLVLGESLLGLEVDSLKSFDVAVHVGTLVAILGYFWKDFWKMLTFWMKGRDVERRLIMYIVIGTVPAVLVGVFLEDWIDSVFRGVEMVGWMMIAVGVLFLLGEKVGSWLRESKVRGKLNWWKALIIGLAQAVALIPGISRSGSTIVAGLFQGIEREKAARFSFLLGAPAMLGAGIWTSMKGGLVDAEVAPMLVGFVVSALVGFVAVWGLMQFLKKHSLAVFAWYLLLLGTFIIIYS